MKKLDVAIINCNIFLADVCIVENSKVSLYMMLSIWLVITMWHAFAKQEKAV